MGLPIQASLSGGSSSAESGIKSGDFGASSGGGTRGGLFNIATGGSRLAASTGNDAGGIPPWVWWIVAGVAGFLWWQKRRA